MVERFFRDPVRSRIKRDISTSVAELELANNLYIATHNAEPKALHLDPPAKDWRR